MFADYEIHLRKSTKSASIIYPRKSAVKVFLRAASSKSTAGFFDASVAEAFAEFEGGGEALAAQFALAELQVRETAEVETVRFAPGILTVWVFGAVEGIASILQGFVRVTGREEGFSENDAEVDREPPEVTGVCQEDAGFSFGNSLRVVREMKLEFAGRVEAAKLEFNTSGAVGELTSILKAPASLSRIVWNKNPGEESVATTEIGIEVVLNQKLAVGLRLAARSRSVTSNKLVLGLSDTTKADKRLAFEFSCTLKVSCSRLDVSKSKA
jgi:hypothetical protein